MNTWTDRFAVVDWWRLPRKLRVRWWTETDYSRFEPSWELEEAVRAALSASLGQGDSDT
jgi:hypothetical protein